MIRIEVESKAETEARYEYKYKPKKNTQTATFIVHMWTGPLQERCFCGRLRRSDPELINVAAADVPKVFGRLCKRCTWYDPTLERRLNGQG